MMDYPIEMFGPDHCVPIEKFTLILKHEYVGQDGKTYLVDQPLMVSSVTPLQNGMSIVSVNVVIQNLTERMKHEAVRAYGGEECKKDI